jgi:endonuclease G
MIIHERPYPLAIRGDAIAPPDDPTWRPVLVAGQPALAPVFAAVGRLECPELGERSQCGTAWLVAGDVAVTNRHTIVIHLADLHRGHKTLRIDFDAEVGASVDRRVPVRRVLYVSPDHDLAFLQLARGGARGRPIALAETIVPANPIGTIAFPTDEHSRYGEDNFKMWFKEGFDRAGQGFKRVTLGRVVAVAQGTLAHDCTTLGGSSGGAIVDLTRGEAIGLNFGCVDGDGAPPRNLGVPAWIVRERLALIER